MDGAELIFRFFPGLTSRQEQIFLSLKEIYLNWNVRINLVSRRDMEFFYERHVLHSLAIARFLSFKPGARILDAGTGGGFPGIPLAVLFPESQFILADSIAKKIKALKEIIGTLNLQNTNAVNSRIEMMPPGFDFIVSRAVASLSQLCVWSKDKFTNINRHELSNGLICLKGGDLEKEIRPFKKDIQIVELANYFELPFFETKKLLYMPAYGMQHLRK